jgi:hypothetical protein
LAVEPMLRRRPRGPTSTIFAIKSSLSIRAPGAPRGRPLSATRHTDQVEAGSLSRDDCLIQSRRVMTPRRLELDLDVPERYKQLRPGGLTNRGSRRSPQHPQQGRNVAATGDT